MAPDQGRLLEAGFAFDANSDAIAAGKLSRASPLRGLGRREEAGSDDHEHIAELKPLDRTSPLALAATLWTSPSASRRGLELESTQQRSATNSSRENEPVAGSWRAFVMGLDQAFERSSRGACEELFALTGPADAGVHAQRNATNDGPEWRGPILPAASREIQESSAGTSQSGPTGATAQAVGSIVPFVLELGEFLLENLVDPMLGHENGSHGDTK